MTEWVSVAQAQADVAAFERERRQREIAMREKLIDDLREDYPGEERFSEVLELERRDAECPGCHAPVDAWDGLERIVVGRGGRQRISTWKCDVCGQGGLSNYRRVLLDPLT